MTYKKGVMIASVISFLIMPWKLMENADSIFIFSERNWGCFRTSRWCDDCELLFCSKATN